MKKLAAILIILALAGGGAYWYYVYGRTPEKASVVQAAISRGDIIEAVSATGTLEALRTVQVGPQVSGTIKDLHGVDFNSIVKKGQVLAELDPTLLQVQVDIQEANIARQQVDIENQKVQLENDKMMLKRTQEQFDKQLVSQQALEQAQLQVKSRNSQIASAEKQLVQANASLAQAKLNVEYCTVRSPIDGVVVDRRVDIGQTVQSSMNVATFFVVATDLTSLKLTAGVDEADIGKVRPNMTVTFSVDSYPQQTFHGSVNAVRLNATTQNNVVTYPVWIDVPNPDLKLRPSMTAQVKIIVHTAENVVRVPNQGLRFRPNSEIYLALGLTPPAAGQGGRGGRGGNASAGAGGQGASAQATAAGSTPPAPGDATGATPPSKPAAGTAAGSQVAPKAGQDGAGRQAPAGDTSGGSGRGNRQPGQGGGGQSGGRGFGQGQSNLTPEQRQAMMDRFAAGGGQGSGGGRGGRTGNRNQQPSNVVTGPVKPITERNADKIDELYEPMPPSVSPGQVWTWDEEKKELKQINIRVGITDGQFSQLLSGDLQVGQQIVTGVVLPVSQRPANQSNNPLMGPQRGNPGFGPGGGGPGGGGGGGRGGGGGGGRGGI
jgi:HlyD family secretion protein